MNGRGAGEAGAGRAPGDESPAIGLFDSGIGGLTVFSEIARTLPGEDLIYLGDTARVPYGTKSRDTVLRYTIQNSLFLLDQKVKALVVACNTASAFGLEAVAGYFRVPVLGVIEPGAASALKATKTKKIGVIGTEGTIRSGAYAAALKRSDPAVEVTAVGTPLLVPLAEEGWFDGPVVALVLEKYLTPLKKAGIDTLILGCTHYPVFKKTIAEIMGPGVALVDSAVETAKRLKETLAKADLLESDDRKGSALFYSTDAPERMERVGSLFLGRAVQGVKKIDI